LPLGQGIAVVVGTNGRLPQQFAIQHPNPTFAQTKFATTAGLQMFFMAISDRCFLRLYGIPGTSFASYWHKVPRGKLGLYRGAQSR